MEVKDKKIVELERSLTKAKKQIEKNSKMEKEICDLKAQNQRQSKEIESDKRSKKKLKVIDRFKFGIFFFILVFLKNGEKVNFSKICDITEKILLDDP